MIKNIMSYKECQICKKECDSSINNKEVCITTTARNYYLKFSKDARENDSTNNEESCIIAIAKINHLKFLKNARENCTIFLCKKHNLCKDCIIVMMSQGINHCLLCQDSNFDNYFNKNNIIIWLFIILLFLFFYLFFRSYIIFGMF